MRYVMNLNREWKFAYGEFQPQTEEEVKNWSDVGIPHSFGIPYFMEHEFYTGYGTYYKRLNLTEDQRKQKLLLEFSGVFQVAQVYLNGVLLRTHKGGYTPFIVELTDLVKEENDLTVVVNNLWDPCIAPRAGEHQFNGGIYRDVKLIVSERTCISWNGTYIYTKELYGTKEKNAVLGAETTINNDEALRATGLITSLWDGETMITSERSELSDPQTQGVCQRFQVEGIQTWSPEHPKLYLMKSELLAGDTVIDCVNTEFGIRTALFDPEEGFFLNGEHYDILGANVHQDHAGWVDAVTHSGIRRDIQMVKDCGMNFIRGSHYPHHTYFAEECDRKGILFWSELCYWGTGGPNQDGYWTASAYPVRLEDEETFEQNCLETLEEMILSNRNRPSIIIWSMCNEVFFTEKNVMDKTKRLLRKLVAKSHQLDPSRVAAVGGVQRGDFDIIGDVAGYNGDGAALYIDPGFPNFVSEYGCDCEDRPGKAEPRYRDGVEHSYKWRSGMSLWCAFHHGSIFGDMGHMGMIDYHRLPLNTWYWYREHLKGIPIPQAREEGIPYRLVMTSDVTEFEANGEEDAWIKVELVDQEGKGLANTLDVTLEVIEGDAIFPTGKTIVLTKENGSFLDGQGAIELHSWYGGKNIIRASADGIIGAEITILVSGEVRTRELIPMTPPPYLTPMPEMDFVYDTAICRPTFASSCGKNCDQSYVTVDTSQAWYPAGDENEWVMADLEGTRKIKRMEIITESQAGDSIVVLLSKDRIHFEELTFIWKAGSYVYEQETQYRYIKVLWDPKMKAVAQICAFVKAE